MESVVNGVKKERISGETDISQPIQFVGLGEIEEQSLISEESSDSDDEVLQQVNEIKAVIN